MQAYTCPKCKTILKREQPVAAGKKIKCPKCATIFAPASAITAEKVGKKEDEDDRNPYLVKGDEEEDDTVKAEKQRAAMGLVKDRFKKSKRGPALAKCVVPANWMTAAGVVMCILYFIVFIVGMFPLVFKSYYLDTPAYKKMDPAALQEEWETIVLIRVIMMVGACVGFVYASLICVAALKMRTIESYGWAMTGAILTTLLGGIWIVIGIWCIMTLRDPAVIEGFAEKKPPPI